MGSPARLRLLLDTHIWLWSLQSPHRLGNRVQRELENPLNEMWLSPISTWEALMLHSKNRIVLPSNLAVWVEKATAPFREAAVSHEIARVSLELAFKHQDPADRFLVATAKVLNLTLVTADKTLLDLSEITTLANL
jgi:PIN domain nuclease of toxin-antitoxin system